MTSRLKIDFVSDVVCPWCAVGLAGLETALDRMDGVAADIRFHPFELNPDMPREGQNIAEHVAEKYGASPEQSAANRETLRERGAAVGVTIATGPDSRIRNSFDAHRLLAWAWEEGRQRPLKHALLDAYLARGADISDVDVLVAAAGEAGLDETQARAVLIGERFAEQVRAEEAHWRGEGVTAVPTIIVEDRYVITGGQPPEAFGKALAKIAEERAA